MFIFNIAKKCITFVPLTIKLVVLSLTGGGTGKGYYSHNNTGKEFLYSVLYFAGNGIVQCTKKKGNNP